MIYEFSKEIGDKLIAAVEWYPSDSDLALACGVVPETLTGWLVDGMRPNAPAAIADFAMRFMAKVADRRKDLIEMAYKHATVNMQANIMLQLAKDFWRSDGQDGPVWKALGQATGREGSREALKGLFLDRDPQLMELLAECGLKLIPID